MAQKRMFSLSVIDTDLFLEMPVTSRLLYYELGMRADDDGFVDNWKKIIKMASLTEDDMKILLAKKFVIFFDSGVIVIRHWRLNNYLRNDRYTATTHQKELAELKIENNVYELKTTENSTMLPDGIPTGIPMVDTDKISIDKISIEEKSIEKRTTKFTPPSLDDVKKYILEKNLKVDANKFFDYFTQGNWIDSKGNKVKNWKQKLLTWNSYQPKEKQDNKFSDGQYDNLDQFYANFEGG